MAAQNDQAKLKKKLEALLKVPDNQYCADCRKRGPRWASANLGIFICIECSGIHRNLGVHISFVRSVNLDSWTKAQVDFMEEWGNKRANDYFEANVPTHVIRPKEGDTVRVVERFIRDKYEFRKYIAKSIPPKHTEEEAVEEHAPVDHAAARRASKHVSAAATPHHHDQNAQQHQHHHAQHHAAQHPQHPHRTASHESVSKHHAPAHPAPVQAPAPAAAAAPSLLDFMDDPVPAPAPAVTHQSGHQTPVSNVDPFATAPVFSPQVQQQQAAPQSNGFDMFAQSNVQQMPVNGGFVPSTGPSTPSHQHMNFNAPPPAPAASGFDFVNQNQGFSPQQQHQQFQQQQQQGQQPPQAPPKPQASADAILSLYSGGGMNRGGPMPMAGGFGQPMYPPNQMSPMMNASPHMSRPGMPAPYPVQGGGYPVMGMQQQQPNQGYPPQMNYQGAPPVNPFAMPPQQQQPQQGGYPPMQQQQFQQPPMNPFRPNSMPNGMPNMAMNPNMQYQQQTWQQR